MLLTSHHALLENDTLIVDVPRVKEESSLNQQPPSPHEPTRPHAPLDLPLLAQDAREDPGDDLRSSVAEPQSHCRLFLEFVLLGLQAWGGPMAQIAMLKQRFAVEKQLISLKQFNRVQGVYQLIPGPEATELCIYFGILSHGRLGGLIAGLGFILPGSLLMLLLSYAYVHFGLGNAYFEASFRGIQPAVAAMMLTAVHRIGKHALLNQDTRQLDIHLLLISFSAALQYLMHVNFLITIALSALWYYLYRARCYLPLMALGVLSVAVYAIVLCTLGFPSNGSVALGVAKTVSPQGLFLLGLLGGLLSVGGAYSAVPFMEAEATVLGHWMTKEQFLASLALSSVIPAPMVIFSAFIGFIGGEQLAVQDHELPVVAAEVIGALLCSVGMFLPAFVITIAAHHLLDGLVHNAKVSAVWDGITACVVGLVAITAIRFVKSSVGSDPLAGLILVGALAVLMTLQHPFLTTFVIAAAAIVGQFFYSPEAY
jgi:putative chromate ion transporter